MGWDLRNTMKRGFPVKFHHLAKRIFLHLLVFLKWVAIASVVGLLLGGVGAAFHFAIEACTDLRLEHSWLIYLLPLAGLAIPLLYRVCRMEEDAGTNLVLLSVRSASQRSPLRTAPLIFVSTLLTHLCGGSAGREGAALQLGGSVASYLGTKLKLDKNDMHMIIMCGMSAAFSALFGTPLTAAVFSMEVISVGVMYYAALVPCLISSIIGSQISLAFGAKSTAFTITGVPALGAVSLLQVAALAALCAGLSILFCLVLHGAGRLYEKLIPKPLLRGAAGGVLVVLLTLLVQTHDYNGAGMDVILRATQGDIRPEAFLLKLLFTAVTLGAGFKGGEIVPSFFVGSTFGGTVGGLLGLSPSFGAGVGLVSLFCGVVNCPITSLVLSIELFGTEGLLLYAVAVGVSYMLSGYYGLYSAQKIVYSKLKTKYVNQETK